MTKKSLRVHQKLNRCKGKSTALVAQETAEELAQLKRQIEQANLSNGASSSAVEPSQPPVAQSPVIIEGPEIIEVDTTDAQVEQSEQVQLTNEASSSGEEPHAVAHRPETELDKTSDAQLEQSESSNEASASRDDPSQPPIEQTPALIDWPRFFEFGNHKIRKTLETPQRVSVHDLITAITDDVNPRQTFSRLKKTHPEAVAACYTFQFPGQGQNLTPVTDAKGTVIIMNLLTGPKAARFRLACANLIVRYLGGDETLITEIERNQRGQETAPDSNPVRMFGEAVRASVTFDETSGLELQSVTNVINFRAPQVYTRQIFGKWSNVHPIGRPREVVSARDLAQLSVVKIGSQGENTKRQECHTTTFEHSKLLDSHLTHAYTYGESKAKDRWKNNGELYAGLYEGKTVRDTELLLVKDQADYERQLAVIRQMCMPEDVPLELQLAQEKSKQTLAEAEARKVEASAEARKAEAEARKAEAQRVVREKELEFETLRLQFEMRKFDAQRSQS